MQNLTPNNGAAQSLMADSRANCLSGSDRVIGDWPSSYCGNTFIGQNRRGLCCRLGRRLRLLCCTRLSLLQLPQYLRQRCWLRRCLRLRLRGFCSGMALGLAFFELAEERGQQNHTNWHQPIKIICYEVAHI